MRKSLVIILAILSISSLTFGQSKEDLAKERNQVLEEIRYTNKLISDTRKAQANTSEELSLLDQQISLRKQLMNSIRRRMQSVERDIKKNQDVIAQKEAELKAVKEQYSKLIFLAYKNNSSFDKMLYIFASEDFHQAWMRMRHLKDIAKYRQSQGVLIADTKVILTRKNEDLLAQKKEQQVLLDEQNAEQRKLDVVKDKKKEALAALQQDEKALKKKLKEQEAQQRKLNKAIESIIAEEMKKSRKANNGTYALTPEEEINSGYFSKNKGKLPWPVERGIITGTFGTHPHPVLAGIEVSNNGIDISTEASAMARSIFDGEVSGVIEIPGSGMAVVVKHGGYRTVYSNLKEVLVAKGQNVSTKQSLGVLLTEGNASKSHFEIWQVTSDGMKKLDPGQWIAR